MKKFLIASYSMTHRYWSFPAEYVPEIRRQLAGSSIRIVHVTDDEAYMREVEDADGVCTLKITPEILARASKLKWVHTTATGVGHLLIPELVSSNIVVTNSRGANSISVAEHVFGLILALTRRIADSVLYQKKRHWAANALVYSGLPLDELYGKVIGIVGFGSIGREIALRARAFGMKIVATKRDPSQGGELADSILPPESLGALLQESDVVVICVPLSWAIGQVIGREELRMMKRSAILVNVARGRVIDEDALIEALRERRIAGAALDVFKEEPLPASSPLWRMSNVVITPHMAGYSQNLWRRVVQILKENLKRFAKDEPLLNVVNKRLGY